MVAKTMHLGRIGTVPTRIFAGLDSDLKQAQEMIGAAKALLENIENELRPRNGAAAGKVNDHILSLRNLLENLENTKALYEKEFYDDDTESAIQENLVATAKAVGKDCVSYMASCVLSEACHSLMKELRPEDAAKATADDIGKFLTTEGIDFAHHARMLEHEMKRIADETDNAWNGRCSIDELCNEFPEANIPMNIALLSRGHDCKLEAIEPAIAKYMKAKGVHSGAVPMCNDDAVLDACHAVFEAMGEKDQANADHGNYEEMAVTEEGLRDLVRSAHGKGFSLRDINGEDDLSPEAFLVKLKSAQDGANPMMDIHADGEGVITFMEKSNDNYGLVYEPSIKEVAEIFKECFDHEYMEMEDDQADETESVEE